MGRTKIVRKNQQLNRRKNTNKVCTTSTQTPEYSEYHLRKAYVLLDKLENVLPEIFEKTREASSMLGPIKGGPSELSRMPKNYNIFVRPITNNERANSTLQDITIEQDEDFTPSNQVNKRKPAIKAPIVQEKIVHKKKLQYVCKPGPKSFKKKFMQMQDINISVMRDDCNNIERPMDNSLSTLVEHSFDQDTPNLSLNLSSFEFNELPLEIVTKDMAIQTDGGNSSGQLPEIVTEKSLQNTSGKPNIRLQFENFTTIITSRSQRSKEDDSSTSSLNDGTQYDPEFNKKKGKYIKISANTVHIHNHFYSNN